MSSRFRVWLEISTNMAVLAVAVLIIGSFVYSILTARSAATKVMEPGLRSGDQLLHVPGIDYGITDRTLLVAFSPNCSYCADSYDFYNRLSEVAKAKGNVHIVVISPESTSETLLALQGQRLEFDIAAPVELSTFNVSTTPTLILVNREGRVLDFWVGKLSGHLEKQVLSALAG
jgi:thioredoxin-related protein